MVAKCGSATFTPILQTQCNAYLKIRPHNQRQKLQQMHNILPSLSSHAESVDVRSALASGNENLCELQHSSGVGGQRCRRWHLTSVWPPDDKRSKEIYSTGGYLQSGLSSWASGSTLSKAAIQDNWLQWWRLK